MNKMESVKKPPIGKLFEKVTTNAIGSRTYLWNYLEFMCANTSTHGGNWLSKVKGTKLKTLYVFGILSLQGTIFYIFLTGLFSPDPNVYTSTDWISDENLTFPYVTVCNPRMFEKRKVEGKSKTYWSYTKGYKKPVWQSWFTLALNISSSLLTYILAGIDADTISAYAPNFAPMVEQLENDYVKLNYSGTNLPLDLSIR